MVIKRAGINVVNDMLFWSQMIFHSFNGGHLLKCSLLTSTSLLKVPLLWVMKGSYFGFGSRQQEVGMHARSKNSFIVW